MTTPTPTPAASTPAPLTRDQARFAAALPAAERADFEASSSADRDELMDVMSWLGGARVPAHVDEYAEARAKVAAARGSVQRPGSYWPRNAETAPTGPELDALIAADDVAIDQALAALDALLTRAARHKDLARRSRQLARVDRALADPATGYLRRLRELRTATLRERRDAGVPVKTLGREAGVSERRIQTLLKDNTAYESSAMRDARAQVRAERDARAAAAKARREAERRASIAQGALWAARVLAGETVYGIAEADGVPWQRVARWVKAANAAAGEG